MAQFPIAIGGGGEAESFAGSTPWWDANKARRCGRLWCSDIYLRGNLLTTIMVGRIPKPDKSTQETAIAIEKRAKQVESTFNSIYGQLIQFEPVIEQPVTISSIWEKLIGKQFEQQKGNTSEQEVLNLDEPPQTPETDSQQTIEPAPSPTPTPPPPDSIFTAPDRKQLSIHPLTPTVAVGIKNGETVVFIPKQTELKLAAQTLITVNEADEIVNGQPISELAFAWRDYIRESFDSALWGHEVDVAYPWARYQLCVLAVLVMIIPSGIIFLIRRIFRRQDQQLRHQQRLLRQSLTIETEGEVIEKLIDQEEEIESETETVSTSSTTISSDIEADSDTAPEAASNPRESSWHKRFPGLYQFLYLFPLANQLSDAKAAVTDTLQGITDFSLSTLQRQSLLRQRRNIIHLISLTLLWLQISGIFLLIAFIVFVFPAYRSLTVLFIGQALFFPLLWGGITIVNKVADIIIDRSLNNWAREQQLFNPESNRYTLRVATYSPAIKGALTVFLVIIGILGTIWLFGINPVVLASFGGVAFIVAFLGRNVVEDMLNGALILATDRYAIGDVIKIGEISGLVEYMNIYITQLRGSEGRLSTIPNGQIFIVENLTKDWSRAEFMVEIDQANDIEAALNVIQQVSEEMRLDKQWSEKIIEPAAILGVDHLASQGIKLQVWIKTQPGQHWGVGREFRLRVKKAFEAAGISLGIPRRQFVCLNQMNQNGDNSSQEGANAGAEVSSPKAT